MEPNKPIIEKTDESRTSDTNNRKGVYGMSKAELYSNALIKYSYEGQVFKLVEKLSSLTQILMKEVIQNKFKETYNPFITTKVIDDWASIKLLIEQIEYYYNTNSGIDFNTEIEELMFKKLQELYSKLR